MAASTTSSGERSAAEPITARATPASASATASATVRTPPPVCTRARPVTAATMARTTGRFTGSPVRAASRSTTWIHRAPASANGPSHGDGVVAVDGLLVEVALHEANGPAGPQIDRRVELHRHASTPAARPVKLVRSRRPVAPDFSGWNWVANTLPCRKAALSVVPYSQVATTSSPSAGTPWREWTK